MRHLKIIVVPGVFDILHIGHIRFLESAKDLGGFLIVSLLSNDAVVEKKGKLPAMPFKERKEVIESLETVNMVICQDHDDIEPTLKALNKLSIKPDVLIRSEYNQSAHGLQYIEGIGSKIVILPYCDCISSSIIKERVKNG